MVYITKLGISIVRNRVVCQLINYWSKRTHYFIRFIIENVSLFSQNANAIIEFDLNEVRKKKQVNLVSKIMSSSIHVNLYINIIKIACMHAHQSLFLEAFRNIINLSSYSVKYSILTQSIKFDEESHRKFIDSHRLLPQ